MNKHKNDKISRIKLGNGIKRKRKNTHSYIDCEIIPFEILIENDVGKVELSDIPCVSQRIVSVAYTYQWIFIKKSILIANFLLMYA